MCQGVPGMKTESVVGWIMAFFVATSFWITVIVPDSYIVQNKSTHHSTTQSLHSLHSLHSMQDDRATNLAIFCLERSGSTWLTAMLNKNDHVNILAEPLQPLATKHNSIADKKLAASMEFEFLVRTVEAAKADPSLKLTGFNENMIFLLRKNVVFQAVSMIRAVQLADRCGNDGWSKTHEKGWQEVCGKHHTDLLKEPIPLHDLKENILRAQKKTDELVKTLKTLKRPYITIYYEDLHDDPKKVMTRISEFTGVKLEVMDTVFVKQGDVNLRKTVPNVDQMLGYLGSWDPCLVDQVKNFNPIHFCNTLATST